MSSIPRKRPLLAAGALTGSLFLAACGTTEGGGATSATPSTAASTGAAQPSQSASKAADTAVYKDPMDVAKKIKKAHLGCAKPARTESLGSGKVICGGAQNISIEFYATPQAFDAVKNVICKMNATSTIVADEGRRWMVTSLSNALNGHIQRAVGGQVVKVC